MGDSLNRWTDGHADVALALVEAARNGDTGAFERMVVHYQPVVTAYARCLLRDDPLQAEDIAQESFLIAFRDLGNLRNAARFAPWLKSIVWRQAQAWVRGQKLLQRKQRELPGPHDLIDPGLASVAFDTDEPDPWLDRLEKLVDEMGDGHKTVLMLFYVRGMTCEEIAAFLDIPTGTVKRRLFDSRKEFSAAAETIPAGEDAERRRFAANIKRLLQAQPATLTSKGTEP